MKKRMTDEQFEAWLQLGQPEKGFSDEEVAGLIAIVYPEVDVHVFVNTFLVSIDMDRFDSDTGHVSCPIACIQAVLAYQRAGGRIKGRGVENEETGC